MKIAPPEGISEADYEAIEAAVMETVRGRWFLTEFARRSRVDEMRQVLDAMARLEHVVMEQRALPADPSIRLLVQRLKDVGQHLDGLVVDMRAQGQDENLCARIEAQARALGGLLRLNAPSSATLAGTSPEAERGTAPRALPKEAEAPRAAAPILPPLAAAPIGPASTDRQANQQDARLAALARLDALPIAEKLALFN
ncbi:MAG: hypothetical protein WCF20_09395 [Methylovirgula sp.]